jgi:hypothetical protein
MELDEDNDGKKVIHISGFGGWLVVILAAYGTLELGLRIYHLTH